MVTNISLSLNFLGPRRSIVKALTKKQKNSLDDSGKREMNHGNHSHNNNLKVENIEIKGKIGDGSFGMINRKIQENSSFFEFF